MSVETCKRFVVNSFIVFVEPCLGQAYLWLLKSARQRSVSSDAFSLSFSLSLSLSHTHKHSLSLCLSLSVSLSATTFFVLILARDSKTIQDIVAESVASVTFTAAL